MPDPNIVMLPAYRAAWFCVTKNANTSVKRTLFEMQGLPIPDQVHSEHALQYGHFRDVIASGFHGIAILRDPVDRLVSCWRSKVMGDAFHPGFKRRAKDYGMWHRMPFDEFVRSVFDIPDDTAEIHVRSQAALTCYEGDYLPRTSLWFPQLVKDWAKAQAVLPDLPNIAWSNRSVEHPANINGATARMVQMRYASDYRLIERVRPWA